MRKLKGILGLAMLSVISLSMTSCAHMGSSSSNTASSSYQKKSTYTNYASRIPSHINTNGRKTIVIDPKTHVWGAYNSSGKLVRAGLASAGARWCADIGRACKTPPGTFTVKSLGSASCKSSLYPKPNGGAPMPYCMFFNGNIGMHGSPPGAVVEGNVSHGCVRMRVHDAQWIRNNFANVGTRVIVKPY